MNSKKHKDEEKKLRAYVTVDDETEAKLKQEADEIAAKK